MKNNNHDYQSIKPYHKAKPNAGFNPRSCFKYYAKKTKGNKVYSLEETFKYIDEYYTKLKPNNKMNASEKSKNQEELIDRLSDLDYDSQISFSIITSIVISIVITLYFTVLQMPNEAGNTLFGVICNSYRAWSESIAQAPDIFVLISQIIVFLVLSPFIILIITNPAICLIVWIRNKYESTKYYNKFLKPYERNVAQKVLQDYDSKFTFLK